MESAAIENQILEITDWLDTGSINIFGLPFSGKDTHGTELSKFFDAPLIGGGDILRSDLGPAHIREHISKGLLAPSEDYLAIVLPFLSQETLSEYALILNSVGRWSGEEESIMEAAERAHHPIKAVLYLNITKAEAIRRWQIAKRNREDDADEKIVQRRFKEFEEKTLPVLDFYRNKGLLIEIDGMPPQSYVTREILNRLHALSIASD